MYFYTVGKFRNRLHVTSSPSDAMMIWCSLIHFKSNRMPQLFVIVRALNAVIVFFGDNITVLQKVTQYYFEIHFGNAVNIAKIVYNEERGRENARTPRFARFSKFLKLLQRPPFEWYSSSTSLHATPHSKRIG